MWVRRLLVVVAGDVREMVTSGLRRCPGLVYGDLPMPFSAAEGILRLKGGALCTTG